VKTGVVCHRVRSAGLKGDAAISDDLHPGPATRSIAVATVCCPWSDRALQHALVLARYFGAILHIVDIVRRAEFSFVPDLMVQLNELAERDAAPSAMASMAPPAERCELCTKSVQAISGPLHTSEYGETKPVSPRRYPAPVELIGLRKADGERQWIAMHALDSSRSLATR